MKGKTFALAAACLFGVSAPLAKLLLAGVQPMQLAGLLYLGAGLGLLLARLVLKRIAGGEGEARLRRKDYLWLLGALISGGVLAPILLMYGLQATHASTASLLLNFEAAATVLVAAVFFREHVSRHVFFAAILITLASVLLTVEWDGNWGFSAGALGVLIACILWGIDNNLTRNISLKNPLDIVMLKGLGAGSVAFCLSLAAGNNVPPVSQFGYSLLLGAFSYGASLVFFILALREIGSARTGAFFGAAPFVGVLLSFVIFGTAVPVSFWASLPVMIIGTILLLKESHDHHHVHTHLAHDHRHGHNDGHHLHEHPEEDVSTKSHSHPHTHVSVKHDHEHSPDIHHRHGH